MEQFLYYALAALIGELWMWFWDRRTIKKLQEEIIKLKKEKNNGDNDAIE